MKKNWKHAVLVVLACLMLFALVIFVGIDILAPGGIGFSRSFASVEVGMVESKVIDSLGAPDARSAEFRLGQYEGFETEYAAAAESNSDHYLLWYKSMDVVYAVGIDGDGKVTMKAVGGT